MPDEILSVQDLLDSVTADIDQAQALIDEHRLKFPNDVAFQKQLDADQFQLDLQIDRVKMMKFIDNMLDKGESEK